MSEIEQHYYEIGEGIVVLMDSEQYYGWARRTGCAALGRFAVEQLENWLSEQPDVYYGWEEIPPEPTYGVGWPE